MITAVIRRRRAFDDNPPRALSIELQSVARRRSQIEGQTRSWFSWHERAVHLIYSHGSIVRPFQASSNEEIKSLLDNADAFADYFDERHVIVIGYAGWKDSIMEGLQKRKPART
jgi:hypothetical protein